MIHTHLYLDTRYKRNDGTYALKLVFSKNGTSAMMPLNIYLAKEQWDGEKVVQHPNSRNLNKYLATRIVDIERKNTELAITGKLVGLSAKESIVILKKYIDPEYIETRERKLKEDKLFIQYFKKYYESKRNPGTKQLYKDTFNKVCSFCETIGINTSNLTFEDIKRNWLEDFQSFCLQTEKQNSASRHLRDIRAVFNSAIDNEITSNYPFRKFKIKTEITKDKSYTSDELRMLFKADCYSKREQESIDIFKLMFCLIGINSVDLANLGKAKNGRVQYSRKKTGMPYSIKLEPEAIEIINKYEGKTHLINIIERTPNYKTYFRNMIRSLTKVGLIREKGKANNGKAILPDICTGAARTSWATIAQEELGISRDIIAAALGHHTNDVTATYLRTDWRDSVDKANRLVLDLVFYKKKKKRK